MYESFGSSGLTKNREGILESPWGEIYGYCRVSTKEQNTARQMDALIDYGVEERHIFTEHVSGKNFNRPMYKRMVRVLRRGDIVVIKSIDRLGRNYDDIIDQWRLITQDIGCGIHVLDMPTLNTSGDPADLLSRFITDMMLQVLSFVAENERENTLKRQREGIEAAKKRGAMHSGRPRVKIPFEFWEVYVIWKTGEMRTKDLIQHCKDQYGICQRTFYRRIRELDRRYGDIQPCRLRDLIMDDYLDGFDYDVERCEAAMGFYNPYVNDPEHEKELKRLQKLRDEENSEEDEREEEEELKRIILSKRQAEFREKFGLPETGETEVKRGRKPASMRHRQMLRDAERASSEAVKTVIID